MGPTESRKRLDVAILTGAVTVVVLILLFAFNASRWWRLFLIVPTMISVLGFRQYQKQTCVRLGFKGRQHMEDEFEVKVDDVAEAEGLRLASVRITKECAIIATAFTLLTLLIPEGI